MSYPYHNKQNQVHYQKNQDLHQFSQQGASNPFMHQYQKVKAIAVPYVNRHESFSDWVWMAAIGTGLVVMSQYFSLL